MNGVPPRAFKYDVAFSFLDPDRGLALKLGAALQPHLTYFVYSERQREIAGQDGSETFARLFKEEARLNVVLLREGWGKTPFTRVEEAAIRDRAVATGWDSMLVVKLDQASEPPVWMPRTSIYMDYRAFGHDESVGVIKASALRQGAELHIESAPEQALRIARERRTAAARAARLAEAGVVAAATEATSLFEHLRKLADEITSGAPDFAVRCGFDRTHAVLAGPRVSTTVTWFAPYTDSLQDAALHVADFEGEATLPGPGERPGFGVHQLGATSYAFGITPEDEWAWKSKRGEWLTSARLADAIVKRHVQRAAAPPPRQPRGRSIRSPGFVERWKYEDY